MVFVCPPNRRCGGGNGPIGARTQRASHQHGGVAGQGRPAFELPAQSGPSVGGVRIRSGTLGNALARLRSTVEGAKQRAELKPPLTRAMGRPWERPVEPLAPRASADDIVPATETTAQANHAHHLTIDRIWKRGWRELNERFRWMLSRLVVVLVPGRRQRMNGRVRRVHHRHARHD